MLVLVLVLLLLVYLVYTSDCVGSAVGVGTSFFGMGYKLYWKQGNLSILVSVTYPHSCLYTNSLDLI